MDKKALEELRNKYIQNPPEGMTAKLVKSMSDADLLDMHYFLTEDDDWDGEEPEERQRPLERRAAHLAHGTGIGRGRDRLLTGFAHAPTPFLDGRRRHPKRQMDAVAFACVRPFYQTQERENDGGKKVHPPVA